MDSRMKEAAKLGFRQALAPGAAEAAGGLRIAAATRLADAISRIGDGDWPGR
jgi:predicted ATP-dependent serine protease